jgi:hypothetical protein
MMRKNTLLVTAAITALTVGTAFAQAPAPEKGGAAPAAKSDSAAPASKNAPAEKMAPATGPSAKGAQRTEDKSVQGAQRKDETAPSNRMGQSNQGTKSKSETTGQAPSERNAAPKDDNKMDSGPNSGTTRSNEPSGGMRSNERANEPNKAGGQNEPNRGNAQNETRGSSRTNVNLTVEQKTKIHQTIIADRGAPRVAHVDFQLNVGVAVPRSVKLASVPATIIEIQPTWRGFEYFLVGDQVVIVDPATLEIVAVIAA